MIPDTETLNIINRYRWVYREKLDMFFRLSHQRYAETLKNRKIASVYAPKVSKEKSPLFVVVTFEDEFGYFLLYNNVSTAIKRGTPVIGPFATLDAARFACIIRIRLEPP